MGGQVIDGKEEPNNNKTTYIDMNLLVYCVTSVTLMSERFLLLPEEMEAHKAMCNFIKIFFNRSAGLDDDGNARPKNSS